MRSHRHTGDGRERIAYLQLRYGVRGTPISREVLTFGGDPAVFNEALQEAADRNKQVASSAWDFEMGAVEFVTPATSMGKQIYDLQK